MCLLPGIVVKLYVRAEASGWFSLLPFGGAFVILIPLKTFLYTICNFMKYNPVLQLVAGGKLDPACKTTPHFLRTIPVLSMFSFVNGYKGNTPPIVLYVMSCENFTWVNVVLGHRFLVTR